MTCTKSPTDHTTKHMWEGAKGTDTKDGEAQREMEGKGRGGGGECLHSILTQEKKLVIRF